MKIVLVFLLVAISSCIAVLFGLAEGSMPAYGNGVAKSNYDWHYRMTVTVETPEGLKSGSAVREVTYEAGLHILPEGLPRIRLRGEAVVIDLGTRGVLFGLLRGGGMGMDYPADIFLTAFNGAGDRGLHPDNIPKRGKVVLRRDQYPAFIRFQKPNDPSSAEYVWDTAKCPSEHAECAGRTGEVGLMTMSKKFGNGVKMRSVTIEVTDEPVTKLIDRYLPKFDNKPHLFSLNDFKSGE